MNDLKQLFIGTEGTLGVVTRCVLRLREAPISQNTALVGIKEFSSIIKFLKHIDSGLGGNMSAYEVMWKEFYEMVTNDSFESLATIFSDISFLEIFIPSELKESIIPFSDRTMKPSPVS